MTLALWTSFLGLVEEAVANPENKAAVKIVRDGLLMWKDIANMPSVRRFEADIVAYERLRAADAPAPATEPAEPPTPEAQNGVRGGPNAGRMSFDQ
jgi:hypothetical protein